MLSLKLSTGIRFFLEQRQCAKPLAESTIRYKESAESKYGFYTHKNFHKKPDSRIHIHPAKRAEIS